MVTKYFMMKVCILSVCHNSYVEAERFLDSIVDAIKEAETLVSLDLYIIDNSSPFNHLYIEKLKKQRSGLSVTYIASDNLGYFPSVSAAIRKYNIALSDYDYVCISNVDLRLSKSFFGVLSGINPELNVGVYAPSIFSAQLNADRNPKIVHRPSAFKLKINKFLFSSRFRYRLLKSVNSFRLRLRQFLKPNPDSKQPGSSKFYREIYASHGSFILFTRSFIAIESKFAYPVFLFGEEIYVAEIARNNQLKVKYVPELLIFDSEHVSTSTMGNSFYRQSNLKALSYILSNFKF